MSLRDLEAASIRAFLTDNAHLLGGRVLDVGCGWYPYRDIVEQAGGDYWGVDSATNPGSVVGNGPSGSVYHMGDDWDWRVDRDGWDAIMCTQVIQYVPDVADFLRVMRLVLAGAWRRPWQERVKRSGGWLLLTGPTNWPHLEPADLHRFTTNGIQRLLKEAEFQDVEVAYRGEVTFEGERWPIGWWAKGRA